MFEYCSPNARLALIEQVRVPVVFRLGKFPVGFFYFNAMDFDALSLQLRAFAASG
jgi:hypothetical protein